MKCYRCKKQISSAIRVFMPAKDRREKAQHRDICDDCNLIIKSEQGYVLVDGIWRHSHGTTNKRT